MGNKSVPLFHSRVAADRNVRAPALTRAAMLSHLILQNGESGGLAVMNPVVCGPEIVCDGHSFACQGFNFANLGRGQCPEIVIPPIKPAPEEGVELAVIQHRHQYSATLSCSRSLNKLSQEGIGLVGEGVYREIALIQGALEVT